MRITRRIFLKGGAMTIAATAAVPSFLTRAVYGLDQGANRRKRLVVLFQRGAADGLNIVVPHGENAYYGMRPSIAIPRQNVLDLDGFFGFHPALEPLKPLWEQKHLALVHAAGSEPASVRGRPVPSATARKGLSPGFLSRRARFSQPSSVDFTPGVPDSM